MIGHLEVFVVQFDIKQITQDRRVLSNLIDVEEQKYLNLVQEIDLSLEFSRNNLEDSFCNLWIQSVSQFDVLLVEIESWMIYFVRKRYQQIHANQSLLNRRWVGRNSNSNVSDSIIFASLSSVTDRASYKTMEVDGRCSHGLMSVGRNGWNGEINLFLSA